MNNSSENSELTKEKIQVYQIVFSMFIQLLLVLAGIVAFFIVLYNILNEPDNYTKMIYGALDTMLGSTIYLVYRHYFPVKAKE
ncbi:MAG TPA: hypothetical protein DIW31_01690 [Bacteroidales bacterium]|nr:hypothetical protein [Bacteroidales bacterium]